MCGWTLTPYRTVVVENYTIRHLKAISFLWGCYHTAMMICTQTSKYLADFRQL